ncbi:unnamed protein product, partial [Prorocentrum cordatum]
HASEEHKDPADPPDGRCGSPSGAAPGNTPRRGNLPQVRLRLSPPTFSLTRAPERSAATTARRRCRPRARPRWEAGHGGGEQQGRAASEAEADEAEEARPPPAARAGSGRSPQAQRPPSSSLHSVATSGAAAGSERAAALP